MKINFKTLVLITLALSLCLTKPIAAAEDEPRPYNLKDNAQVLSAVDLSLAKARMTNKLALIVLGANWCHDSRGLAARLQSDQVAGLIKDNYELLYIDIGVYEENMRVVERFGLPIMFGTPTVLVIEPHSEKLLNGDSMHMWLDAAKVTIADTKANFESLLNLETEVKLSDPSPQLQALFDQISEYEKIKSERIAKGYQAIAPLLRARINGQPSEKLEEYWAPHSRMRYGVANSLIELRKEAVARTAAGEQNIELVFPSYDPMPWE